MTIFENNRGSLYARRWHPTKNYPTEEYEVSLGSNRKVWWICEKGHESLTRRAEAEVRGYGCPYCTNRLVCRDNCLATVHPQIAKQWHPEKNDKLTPQDVLFGSAKKAWWLCDKGHSWRAKIVERISGTGCPYCAHVLVCEDNCLAILRPDLILEWDFKANGSLTPHNEAL